MINGSHFGRFYFWAATRLFPAATREAVSQPAPTSIATAGRWFLASLAVVFVIDVLITHGFFFATQERTGYSLAGICLLGLVVAMWRSRREHLAYEAMLAAERARDEAESISAAPPPA